MTDRILDFSESPASLSIRNSLLVVTQDGQEVCTVPCEEIAMVIVANRQVIYTQAVAASLAEAGATMVCCNQKHQPVAMMMPLVGHHLQAERFVRQAAMASPKAKRLWQHIVREKIGAQARLLTELHSVDFGLNAISRRVSSGDSGNLESFAARKYWTVLFGPKKFLRGDETDPRNHLLDYGYAVLRAATSRAITAAGLHPSFGLHHQNRLNAFALADDLMEPFRPCVDRVVVQIATETEAAVVLNTEVKRRLIGATASRYETGGEERSLFDILTRLSQSLAAIVMGEDRQLSSMDWRPLIP